MPTLPVIQSKAMNEVDAGRDRATPTSVRHDDNKSLTPEEELFVVNG
jgi:hypothetical protein